MDRKEFLKGCATGLCACVAACMPAMSANAADGPKPEDWKLPFVKRRYAKLLAALQGRVDGAALTASLQDMGAYCSSENDAGTKKFAGNVDGFAAEIAKNGSTVERKGESTYVLTYDPKGDCFCPFNSLAAKTPGVMCECSAGWARHTWGIILGKEPKVAIAESVLRGGKVCRFEITKV